MSTSTDTLAYNSKVEGEVIVLLGKCLVVARHAGVEDDDVESSFAGECACACAAGCCPAVLMMMTTIIMIIIGFSTAMGWLLAIDQVPQHFGNFLFDFTDDKNVFLALMLVFILLIGCVVEGVPAKLMLVPMLLPIIDQYGVDRVHFGIIIQLGLLIGIATPPMGIGLYIVSEVGKVPFERLAIAVIPFLVPLIVVLLMLTYIPQLTLWLPNLVLGPE